MMAMTGELLEAGCPIRDNDHWPRWLKVRDGTVIWFKEVADWDGEWIAIETVDSEVFDWDDGKGMTMVNDWIKCRPSLGLRATYIRWSEVVAHGEVSS